MSSRSLFSGPSGQDYARKSHIARDFGRASGSYDAVARLQRHMGQSLLKRGVSCLAPERVLDLGCGTGQFVAALHQCFPDARLMGADLSADMIRYARDTRKLPETDWLVADAESLPLADGTLDLIFSNLMIQWCADPRSVLRECLRVLRPGGVLLCSTLVEGTLAELDAAWQSVDPGKRHINRFETLESLTGRVGEVFPQARVVPETVRLPYDSPRVLLRELKSLGAGYKDPKRRQTLTAPGRIRQMCEAYPATDDGSIQASYEAVYLICRRPEE